MSSVENGNRQVGNGVRVLKLQLEQGLGQRVPLHHPIMAWIVDYSAMLLTKCHPSGDDHLTGYERFHGKDCNERLPECSDTLFLFCANAPGTQA